MDTFLTDPLLVTCPYCGEEVELEIDADGGSRQNFVQDCYVCCSPWQVELRRDREGYWTANVRTQDE